uniref:BZIP domain-containing protein n=1 Tax=Solanum lycopersicum TaxID=4081 RepID=K4BG01_SOLLC
MNEKRNKSAEPNLSLSLKTPIEYESINNIPTLEEAVNLELKNGQVDPNVNMKKLRRTISNRLSAQRARMRKIEYTDGLKKEAKNLEIIFGEWRRIVSFGKGTVKDPPKPRQFHTKVFIVKREAI